MAAIASTMVPIGTVAPDFCLVEPKTGAMRSLNDARGQRGTLVMFICNHCPYVKQVAEEIARIGHEFLPMGVGVVAINSNDADMYPGDSPEKMVEESKFRGYSFPYLFDQTQDVARAYDAQCTPDYFLFDADLRLVYRGQLDDARPGRPNPVTGQDLRKAIDALLHGRPVLEDQIASVGCSIKWKL